MKLFKDFLNLFWLVRELAKLPTHLHMVAHKDPTMLFSGLMFGRENFLRCDFHKIVWNYKIGLFYYGDLIVEKCAISVGTKRLREHFESNSSRKKFYDFCPEFIKTANAESEYDNFKLFFGKVERDLWNYEYFSEKCREGLFDCFIDSWHQGIKSAFFQEIWNRVSLEDHRLWKKALRVVKAEEYQKNVRVVTAFLQSRKLFPHYNIFLFSDNEIVAKTSRWFTLLDDPLDLKEDMEKHSPNYLIPFAMRFGELSKLRKIAEDYSNTNAIFDSLKNECPRTFMAYKREYQKARREFIISFPFFSRLFVKFIEKRAFENNQSPF